jgi:hypothetical protein
MPPTPDSSPLDFKEMRRKADECARHAPAGAFARFEQLREQIDVNVPIVSALIERDHDGEKEILVQTHWKPDRDPHYTHCLSRRNLCGGMHFRLTVRAFFLEFRKFQHVEFGSLMRLAGFWAKLTTDSPSNLQVRAERHHKH